jgi:hypothetical protein
MKQSIEWDGDVITIRYEGGIPAFTGDCGKLPQSIYQPCAAARHGIAQKLGDAKSGGTAREKRAEVEAIWAALMAGQWRRGREGAVEETVLLARALAIVARAKGLTGRAATEAAEKWLKKVLGLSPEDRDTFMRKSGFKAALNAARAEIRLERLSKVTEESSELDLP